MDNETVSVDKQERKKYEEGKWVNWLVPIVLLLFVLAIVSAAALSNRLRTASENGNIVIYILTALLCTLVAVSLALTGCTQWFKKIEQNIQSLATNAIVTRNEQLRLGKAGLNGNEEIGKKISLFEENQCLLRDEVGGLKDIIEREHKTLLQSLQDNKQELANDVTVVAQIQQEIQTSMSELKHANELTSEMINTIGDGQAR